MYDSLAYNSTSSNRDHHFSRCRRTGSVPGITFSVDTSVNDKFWLFGTFTMDGREEFFLTLTSDTKHYLGVQEPSDFRTNLSKPLKLDPQKFQVALVEIIYPNTLINIHDADFIVMYPAGMSTEERHGRIENCRVDSREEMVETVEYEN